MPNGNPPAAAMLAERLLTIPHRLALLATRREFVLAAADEVAAVLGATVDIHWNEGQQTKLPAAAARVELTEQLLTVATLLLSRDEPFSPAELQLLEPLSESLSFLFSMKSMSAEHHLLAKLSVELSVSQNLEQTAQLAVNTIARYLRAESVALILTGEPEHQLLAASSGWPDEVRLGDLHLERYSGNDAVMLGPKRIACPITGGSRARCVLVVDFPADEPGVWVRRSAIELAAMTLAPHLEAGWRTMMLEELLKLNEASANTPTRELYQEILQTAVLLVPGADSGSLCTRTSTDQPFVFQAVVGFSADEMLGQLSTEAEAIAWYGPDLDGWQHGRPREIRNDTTDIIAFGNASSPDLSQIGAGYNLIQASLSMPVLHNGEVLAVLNLENQTDPGAFGRDAVDAMRMFGAPLASLLHRQQLRDLLLYAALNDELSGLANRRAFNEAAGRAFANHQRSGKPLSILAMDLKGFKQVNDTLGHDVGDTALVRVSRALQSQLRDGDLLSRLGGDEFSVLMIDTSASEAACVAERLREAVAQLEFEGLGLRINIGAATAPEDGASMQEIAVVADRRMYRDKWGG